jgi:hypothetical protein
MNRPLKCLLIATFLEIITFPGCMIFGPDSCICTMEYESVVVHIQDGAHNPIDSLVTTSTIKRTGKTLKYKQYPPGHGNYVVLEDDATKDVDIFGETINFHAQNSNYTIDRQFLFDTDNCRCHIRKVSGPDTITVVIPVSE